jgi:hypothetical protein
MSGRKSINNGESGWICMYRSLGQSSLWLTETFTRGQAWADMLLLANYSDGFIRVRGNRVTVKRGQLGWSMLKLSQRWDWSRDKVKRFFNELESNGMIQQQTSRVTSIITIINYDLYQNIEQLDGITTVSNKKKTGTNNKNNNENNENKGEVILLPPDHSDVISFFKELESNLEEAEKFMDYYTANGWKINRNPMKDWKAAARNWVRRSSMFNQKNTTSKPSKFIEHETDF